MGKGGRGEICPVGTSGIGLTWDVSGTSQWQCGTGGSMGCSFCSSTSLLLHSNVFPEEPGKLTVKGVKEREAEIWAGLER